MHLRHAFELLVESALQALLGAVGVMIAIGLTRWLLLGLLGDMLPDLPTDLPTDLAAKGSERGGSLLRSVAAGYNRNPYGYAYLISFAGLALRSLAIRGRVPREGGLAERLDARWRWIVANWFSLVIGNAWGAFIGAIVILFLAQFSLLRIVIEAVLVAVQPLLFSLAEFVASGAQVSTAELAVAWYGEHEFRILFWSLYLSNILDDLGVPNLKSLWRRFRARRSSRTAPG